MRFSSFRGFVALLPLVIVSSHCISTLDRTPEDAWARVVASREDFEGAKAYAKVRVVTPERIIRFNARILVSSDGRMEMSGLSPFGTSMFTLNFEPDRVVLRNHREKTIWEGDATELPEIVGLKGSFSTRSLPFLLFALPPDRGWPAEGEETGGFLRVTAKGGRAIVGRQGIVELTVEGGDGSITARYSLPSMPPRNVTIRPGDGDETVEIEHLDLSFGPTEVGPVEIDPSYTRIENR